MNSRINKLYFAIKNNEVMLVTTSLAEFVREMSIIDPGIRSLSYYQKTFKKQNKIIHVTPFREVYTLQIYFNNA